MRRVVLREYDWLCSDEASASRQRRTIKRNQMGVIPAALFERLRAFDLERARKQTPTGKRPEDYTIFEWDEDDAKAREWVGVLQIDGLQVEVVPKVDRRVEAGVDDDAMARHNLLTMLSYTPDTPIRERDLASLVRHDVPLHELLFKLFADRLERELIRGVERGYVERHEDLATVRGRIDLTRQVLAFGGRGERFACVHDVFEEDTALNRILLATALTLSRITTVLGTQKTLRHCTALLGRVQRVPLMPHLFTRVRLTRQTERFEPLLALSEMLLGKQSPGMSGGDHDSFSLFFSMSAVYEGFVGGFYRRHVEPLLPEVVMREQGGSRKFDLLFSSRSHRGRLKLEPDFLFECEDEEGELRNFVIDTKWKRIDWKDSGDSVKREDLYQLHAYMTAYEARHVALLYPDVGVEDYHYELGKDRKDGIAPSQRRTIMVRSLDVTTSLEDPAQREALASRLAQLVRAGLELDAPPA